MVNFHKRSVKIILLSMVAALSLTTVGAAAYAAGSSSASEEGASAKITETVSSVLDSERTVGKDETVYALANADGSVKKVIVSEWLKNPDGASALSDATNLENIENTKGDEGYTVSSDNMKVWDAAGNDIYYQGTTNEPLPVGVSVHYYLDGKEVSTDELAGKSGHVTMRFDYQNTQTETVEIDGEQEQLYVPFVMVTGMILDNENFTNVEVSNGKLVNDGDRTVVMGFALPGMQENLNIDADEMEIPSYVEISADVTDFSLTTTLTLATTDLFNDLNLDDVDSLDDLSDSLSELSDASEALVDGSSELYNGLETLLGKSGELISGIDALASGAKELSTGAGSLKTGSDQLNAGIISLDDGLSALEGNSDTLVAGAKQVFESLLGQANTQLHAAGVETTLTIDNYHDTLANLASSTSPEAIRKIATATAREKVAAAVTAQEATIREQVTAAVQAQVLSAVLEASGQTMSAEDYSAALKAGQIPSEVSDQINAAVSAQLSSDDIQAKINETVTAKENELIESNLQAPEIQAQIEAAVSQNSGSSETLTSLLNSLDSYNQFYQGLIAYTSGVSQAAAGSGQLKSGASQLSSGASQLASGADTLYEGLASLQTGSGALVDGVKELRDGSMQLSDGMKEFNEDGIQKLVGAMDGDALNIVDRLKAIVQVSRNYQSFGGIAEGTEGTTKFIFTTDGIEKEDEPEETSSESDDGE